MRDTPGERPPRRPAPAAGHGRSRPIRGSTLSGVRSIPVVPHLSIVLSLGLSLFVAGPAVATPVAAPTVGTSDAASAVGDPAYRRGPDPVAAPSSQRSPDDPVPCVYTQDNGRVMITTDPEDSACPDTSGSAGADDHWTPMDPEGLDLRTMELVNLAHRVAVKHRVDHRLVEALVEVESGYDPRAVSSRGALGLMQLTPDLLKRYEVERPFDAWNNLDAGVRHLRSLLLRFRMNLRLALAAYNAGAAAVIRHAGVPPFPETERFVDRVLRSYRSRLDRPAGGR